MTAKEIHRKAEDKAALALDEADVEVNRIHTDAAVKLSKLEEELQLLEERKKTLEEEVEKASVRNQAALEGCWLMQKKKPRQSDKRAAAVLAEAEKQAAEMRHNIEAELVDAQEQAKNTLLVAEKAEQRANQEHKDSQERIQAIEAAAQENLKQANAVLKKLKLRQKPFWMTLIKKANEIIAEARESAQKLSQTESPRTGEEAIAIQQDADAILRKANDTMENQRQEVAREAQQLLAEAETQAHEIIAEATLAATAPGRGSQRARQADPV